MPGYRGKPGTGRDRMAAGNVRRRCTELKVIQRASAYTGQQTEKKLQTALDAASEPTPGGLIIRGPDGEPARVSQLECVDK